MSGHHDNCSSCPRFADCVAHRILGNGVISVSIKQLHFARGDNVRRDTVGTAGGLSVIKSGIALTCGYLENGEMLPSCILGDGDVCGESALLKHVFAPGHFIFLTDTELCVVDRKSIYWAMDNNKAAPKELIATCLNSQGAQLRTIWILNGVHVIDRVGRLLSDLALKAAIKHTTDKQFCITQDFIAAFIHAERATITRCLHKLQEQGYIEIGRRMITLTEKFLASDMYQNNPWLNTFAYSVKGKHPFKGTSKRPITC
ncbi:MAG: Crp/Fnr family transcriptional regulator [Coriobacteriales bacterium]|jgi:CRP-like cAMP-binding protein|nr:Crp/Fnr family transcriptional regulator [Coriobacteriales bacterium]